jgi:hypothetical protein
MVILFLDVGSNYEDMVFVDEMDGPTKMRHLGKIKGDIFCHHQTRFYP